MNRKPTRALVGLALSALMLTTAGLAHAEDHEIRLTRPMKKGDKYWLMAKGTRADSSVMTKDGQTVDGKSIMQLMMLAATSGSVLEIRAQGPDSEKAVDVLVKLVESKFDEE